jgi:hypothetical protein
MRERGKREEGRGKREEGQSVEKTTDGGIGWEISANCPSTLTPKP